MRAGRYLTAVLLSVAFMGCEQPRMPVDSEAGPVGVDGNYTEAISTESVASPTVDSHMASSGTTAELDAAVIADEQLKKTVNPNADAAWGDWAVDSATLSGEALPNEAAATISLYIDEKTYIVNLGEQVDKGTVIVRRNVQPMELDITGTEGPNAGKTLLAIFDQADSNSLIVCYALDGRDRPKEFTSTAETGHCLVKYKRKVAK